jgi:uncharacterized protein
VTAALYVGWLRHRRAAPVAHEFTYPLFMVLLDIDCIRESMRVSRLTSYNRWNWATFDDRDHFGDPQVPLRERLALDAARLGDTLPDGQILMLANLRYLGYCFNPVSFFYCFDKAGVLRRILAEVNNTFGGSHNYWLEAPAVPSADDAAAGVFRATAKKSLYVSPFMEHALDYAFAFTPPGERLVAHIDVNEGPSALFDATLSLERQPWSAAEIRRVLARHPLMTAKVVAAIHWEAFRLWRKGVRVVRPEIGTSLHPAASQIRGDRAMSTRSRR